jgi:hypothetical protein
MVRPEAQLAEALREVGGMGEGMTARPGLCGEVPIEVDEDGARDVARVVLGSAAGRFAEDPANVGDPKHAIAEARGEVFGRDQRPRVRHRTSMPVARSVSGILSRGRPSVDPRPPTAVFAPA